MESFVDDELQSQSGSDEFETGSGHEQNPLENQSSKRKKYHRHTAHQIQELETAFKDNPHPDEKSRLDLGSRLGLESKQVKFWFQNRRTQVKTQVGRHENSMLKQENDKLRVENIAIKEVMKNPICNNCGAPAILCEISSEQHQLLVENAKLKDELNKIRILVKGRTNGVLPTPGHNSSLGLLVGQSGGVGSSRDVGLGARLDYGNPLSNISNIVARDGRAVNGMRINCPHVDKSIAVSAMDELITLTQPGGSLWFRSPQCAGEFLDVAEYMKVFSSFKYNNLVSQGTRASGIVKIDAVSLMGAFMDPDKWVQMFPHNISRASVMHVKSVGQRGTMDGALQLMQAEFQILSPMVPVRQVKFLRFCKQRAHDIWVVVDVSVDPILDNVGGNTSFNFRRFPSGCVVQDLRSGLSKVTWVEHIEYDEKGFHEMYKPSVRSGRAFGAYNWVTNLQRHCELTYIKLDNAGCTQDGEKKIKKLAKRMTRSFATGICSTLQNWKFHQMKGNTKLMVRESTGHPGEPTGKILSVITTIWMPILPQLLFQFLQDENHRVFWDIFSHDRPMEKLLQISKTQDSGNSTNVLRGSVLVNNNHVIILQDTFTDAFASYVVQASMDMSSINAILRGGDSDNVAILPYGFVIVPTCDTNYVGPTNGQGSSASQEILLDSSLLTVGFQILVNNGPNSKPSLESIGTVETLISQTIKGIKGGLINLGLLAP